MTDSSLNNVLIGKNLFLAASIGGTALVSCFSLEHDIPSINNTSLDNNIIEYRWEQIDIPEGFTLDDKPQNEVSSFLNFINEINLNSEDIDEEIQKVVVENFWDLI